MARRVLHVPGLSVATTVLEVAMADPLAPLWRPVGEPIRLSLLDLSRLPTEAHQSPQVEWVARRSQWLR
jgi:hypothetical protein